MKSIVETVKQMIEEKNDFVSVDDVIKNLDADDVEPQKLKALIYTDLITDGQFFVKDNQLNLKENFTMKEINKIRSQGFIDDVYYEEKEDIIQDEESDTEEVDSLSYEEKELNLDEFIDNDNFDDIESSIDD